MGIGVFRCQKASLTKSKSSSKKENTAATHNSLVKQCDYASKNYKKPRRLNGLPMCRDDASAVVHEAASEFRKLLGNQEKPRKKRSVEAEVLEKAIAGAFKEILQKFGVSVDQLCDIVHVR